MKDDVDLTVEEARRRYFEENRFGPNGGYDDAWVDFKLGPFPFPFPNTASRVRAVAIHDVNHVATGYRTDFTGELEIAAYEIGAGCRDFAAAWALNLGGMGAGPLVAPRRVLRAFVRGRRSRTLYGEDLDGLLALRVTELRRRFVTPDAGAATGVDVALFVVATAAGFLVGSLLFALFLPLVPVGLVVRAALDRGKTLPT